MRIFRGVLGKKPSGPKGRVRNFIANKELGTTSDIHENVISPGVTVPWHFHETEEVIVVLEGNGECRTDLGTEAYAAGDPATTFLEADYPDETVDVFNPSEWAKATSPSAP